MSFVSHVPKGGWISILNDSFHSLVTGGQVSRVDPESTGLNPVWRNSLVYTVLVTTWPEGSDETQIEAIRQRLVQDMKTLEGVAPNSGAYLNEASRLIASVRDSFFSDSSCPGM